MTAMRAVYTMIFASLGITCPRALFNGHHEVEQLFDQSLDMRTDDRSLTTVEQTYLKTQRINRSDVQDVLARADVKAAPDLTAAYPERTSARVHAVTWTLARRAPRLGPECARQQPWSCRG
jgi:2-methylcitrate dehydratase PrpD